MAVGTYDMAAVNNEFGRGSSFSNYAGTSYYYSGGLGTFPSSNLSMSHFIGTSPDNEWACACACNCGK